MFFRMRLLLIALLTALMQADADAAPRDEILRGLAPPTLKSVRVPEPPDLDLVVRDRSAAKALGKALFWDTQAGSDGKTACASCHFQAGADGRSRNTLNPGPDGHFDTSRPDTSVTAAGLPFYVLENPEDSSSKVLRDVDDVVGSQGVVKNLFAGINPGSAADKAKAVPDPVFQSGGRNVRQVTGRNAPSVINAVFNHRNFWDGRANFVFNGRNPFGARDPSAVVYVDEGAGVVAKQLWLQRASLASQAVGPPNNPVEMAYAGRTWRDLAAKLLSLRPLGKQRVHKDDSVLGLYSRAPANGLSTSYKDLIEAAFQRKYWESRQLAPDGQSLLASNFPLFWGLAIQLYEATLVSDDTPFDRFMEGDNGALTVREKEGLDIFVGATMSLDGKGEAGRCINCHAGPEFTGASLSRMAMGAAGESAVERMPMTRTTAATRVALYDSGFYNIGISLTARDLGVGGLDPFGNPLSFSRQAVAGSWVDTTRINLCGLFFNACVPISPLEQVAVEGSFKAPSLRNVALTPPYFHSGGVATLEKVVEFYTRGGNFAELNVANLDRDIELLPDLLGSPRNQESLVAFLRALTDDRVLRSKAPFDHPSLIVPNGPILPAVGRSGGAPIIAEFPRP